ncbi:(2Fe-2S)-binding protein [bacterium]|nr:(2Fe-2S)-binding protein [bacterium]
MVTKCVCSEVTFEKMKQVSDKHKCINIQCIQRYLAFGEACGMCRPYVKKMLETGETKFEVIW